MFSIQNKRQQDFIIKLLNNVREYNPVWLGLHDLAQEEKWQWLSGLF